MSLSTVAALLVFKTYVCPGVAQMDLSQLSLADIKAKVKAQHKQLDFAAEYLLQRSFAPGNAQPIASDADAEEECLKLEAELAYKLSDLHQALDSRAAGLR